MTEMLKYSSNFSANWDLIKPFLFVTAIHKDVTERLSHDNPQLYRQVKKVLEKNKQERHIRGGMATRKKYRGEYTEAP